MDMSDYSSEQAENSAWALVETMVDDTRVHPSDSHTMLDGGGSYGTVSSNPAKQLMLAGGS